MAKEKYLLVIAGPTGVGKTSLAVALAKYYHTVVISADSRQLYKEMSIGTAKPDLSEKDGVKHYMLDCVSIHEPFTAGDFERETLILLDDLFKEHDLVILCGGTGLYIDAVCRGFDEGLVTETELKQELEKLYQEKGLAWLQSEVKEKDPVYFSKADIHNPRRLLRALEVITLSGEPYSNFRQHKTVQRNFTPIKILISQDREVLYERINLRVDKMMKKGLLEEVEKLYSYRNLNALNTVGYKELFEYFEKKISLEAAVDLIKQHSRNYAKRQLTWFRKDKAYETFGADDFEKIKAYVDVILQHSS